MSQDHIKIEMSQDHIKIEMSQDHIKIEMSQDHTSGVGLGLVNPHTQRKHNTLQ